ncbi:MULTISPECIES: tRNA isopentenyl-2-thiomethyl-A-37 hydroxylase MiaE [unclassified Pseudoalteromonas]|uniref:tRNA isopentenyl-2-thiomethyl-A-37 hydroxylase MiaE n=1 Tax=unclassified Pseudoalteromonas TaxID=194690 RepID=UPI001107D744|nr:MULTISPECIES: tRNA isopentenyl-2-thiomethyl-A-37 hydroxylase MiaE [unclassified Pseudoalteromonas]TMN83974.1 tRNA-(ms[2]io[6]A)-hydroxylase [Pseudoalteromonas sp. S410]TMN88940.1 tRNA-(ms[2]io[6]A)-hydroxylase [Pseudoalteromonas sp. S408]TMN96681.1 tRNA-(ms[2]io[6]A)-hydroxylase [Pseudoalteromonas sp. S409]TMN98659.1 tRNA-(ms[2]io[6]A)-hydroxylase [Pseudoalteromonas sp. S407]TMO06107.1 tRNA-(ms[2]io[6]A)-hydroxylase [Pseudoalteromonas sp. S186]
MPYSQLLEPIHNFLLCKTPTEWVDKAVEKENLPVILIDHLICELKAAQSAMFLIRKYAVDKESGDALLAWLKPFETLIYKREGNWRDLAAKNKLTKSIIPKSNSPYGQDLIDKMVLLIKEELHHFYQVLEIMDEYGVEYQSITPCRYAKGMLRNVKTFEPNALVDKLIVGAYIEARSCERFAKLAPHVDKRLGDFYISLLRSEARHYQDYLALAQEIADFDITERVKEFGEIEAQLILSADEDFKFHSGTPA